jgi:hypothetical protein
MSLGTSLGDRVELLGYLNAHLGVDPIKDHMGSSPRWHLSSI